MARRLAREEAIFAGPSTGANVVAALSVATRLGPNATVATVIIDSGLRYLSTDVYQPWAGTRRPPMNLTAEIAVAPFTVGRDSSGMLRAVADTCLERLVRELTGLGIMLPGARVT